MRNQLTVKHTEDTVPLTDDRLHLVKTWLESDNGARELFNLWSSANTVCNFHAAINYCAHNLKASDTSAVPYTVPLFVPSCACILSKHLPTSCIPSCQVAALSAMVLKAEHLPLGVAERAVAGNAQTL